MEWPLTHSEMHTGEARRRIRGDRMLFDFALYLAVGPVAGLLAGLLGIGYICTPAALAVALASMLMAPVGMHPAHRLHATRLKRVFAAFLLVVPWGLPVVVGALIASGRWA